MALRLPTMICIATLLCAAAFGQEGFGPGERVLLDAHNCYPYQGRWADRIERALSTGLPIAIEQDLVWYTEAADAPPRSIVSHGKPFTGEEPSLDAYFFEAVRPHVTRALESGDTTDWPLITLNLDVKDNVRPHTDEIWNTLKRYEAWITTAPKTENIADVQPLDVKPILVLSKGNGAEFESFYESVPVGGRLLVFGVAQSGGTVQTPPEEMVTAPADNFRRWWNAPWSIIEEGGQRRAGEWTAEDRARLDAVLAHAHRLGYWMRIYTLNGHEENNNGMGWSGGYNFGSMEAVTVRWRASIEAGLDFVATDMYEAFSAEITRR